MSIINLLQKPIAFHPVLAKIFGSIHSAIYFQQIYYWSDKGKRKDGFFYKSKKEFEEETTLSRYQQDKIREKLESMGVIETKLIQANGAPTLHFKICPQKIEHLLQTFSNGKKLTNGLVRNLPMEKRETYQSITENTTENTTKETKAKKGELSLCEDKKVLTKNKDDCPYEEIVELYHKICVSLPKIYTLNKSRKSKVKRRWKNDMKKLLGWRNFFYRVERSSFLTGKITRWKASFDWIIKESNALRILEGNYDN